MNKNNELVQALRICVDAHKHQCDKGGMPYCFHPISVMNNVKGVNEKITALLHDVLEDSNWEVKDLISERFCTEIIDAVILLTKNPNVDYMEYIKNLKNHNIAKQVKIADLKDNMDLSRLKEISKRDLIRNDKYLVALNFLNKGE